MTEIKLEVLTLAKIKRIFLIVLDSFGIGNEPDAADFGDGICNTLKSISASEKFFVPNLEKLGLFNIDGVEWAKKSVANPAASFARLQESSRGKDTTIGHWEIAGVISKNPLPTYPEGFPPEIISELEKAFGKKIICNKPYSGTAVIHDFGEEHLKTDALIVYTSADSVLQIAAHKDIVSLEELYNYCKIARKIMQGSHGVGRVIARPFTGSFPNFERAPERHDFSLQPPAETILDALQKNNLATIGVGKIFDIFAGKGISETLGINFDNTDGMKKTFAQLEKNFEGLCFVNLVDFDMKFGHRRDVDGYADAMTTFDLELGEFLSKMKSDDLLMITADHGCDPAAPGTDHTREYVPLLVYGQKIRPGINLGTCPTFSVIAATLAEIFAVEYKTRGESFYQQIKRY